MGLQQPRHVALMLSAVLLWGGSVIGSHAADDPFPKVETLQGNVGFWIRVFSEWSRGEAAIHDLDHPAIVYEVAVLPGAIEESYTDEQKDFLEDVREGWEAYLKQLRNKVREEAPLDEVEHEWVEHIHERGGPDALEEAHERVRSQRGLRERFREGLERSFRYDEEFRRIFREAGLPEDLAVLPHVESSFQYHARSSAGATGLWQFTRSTGRRFLSINSAIDERLDPVAATRGAAAYLAEAYEKLQSWPLALTAYNHGVHGMARAKERFGDDFGRIYREYDGRTFGFASKNFYAEFLAAREVAGDPDRYFPEGYAPESPPAVDHVSLTRRTTPGRIANRYGVSLERLAELNPSWSRRAIRSGLALPSGTQVWLPPGSLERVAQSPPPARPVRGRDGDHRYVVQRGDTLSEIARASGVSLATLRSLNGISRGSSLIRVGQKLKTGAAPPPREHAVRRGETLSDIARMYEVSVSSLRDANGMGARQSLIRVGQKLALPYDASPSVEQARHVVRRGENLSRIAKSYGVRLMDVLSANRLTHRSVIHPGQTILIPGG